MRATRPGSDGLETLRAAEAEWDRRWPRRMEPSLTRIAALADLLGSPQPFVPMLYIAGPSGECSRAGSASRTRRKGGIPAPRGI